MFADGAVIKGSVFLGNGFKAKGQVRLPNAQIGGNLECDDATFQNPSGNALFADGAVIKGSVFLGNGFKAKGQVRLPNAQIGGNLECDDATFENMAQDGVTGSGNALNVDGAVVKGGVFLTNGFKAKGEVRLLNAQIGGNLSCSGATFDNPPQAGGTGDAFIADRAVIRGSVFFNNYVNAKGEVEARLNAKGTVRLLGAQIGSNLDCRGATFENPPHAESKIGHRVERSMALSSAATFS